MKKILKKATIWLQSPSRGSLWYLIILFLLASSSSVYYWLRDGNLISALDLAARGLIVCYAIVLFCDLFKGKAKKALYIFFVVCGIINLILDKCVYNICHIAFSYDAVGIIMGSNLGETKEFCGTYLTPQVVIFILAVLIVCVVIYYLRNWITKLADKIWMGVCVLVVLSFCFVLLNEQPKGQFEKSRWDSVFVCKVYLFATYDKPVDLNLYRQNPAISTIGEQPANVIIVIGESMSRSHCSVYGYGMDTTPYQRSYLEKDSLIVFSQPTSAFCNTLSSFKKMLTQNDTLSDEEWYRRLTVFDVLSSAGIRTEWLSNQSSSGFLDNVVANFAHLADTALWVGKRGVGVQKQDYDELLVPALDKELICNNQSDCHTCYFVHMMGCHESFHQRYPESFARFNPMDYLYLPEHQRNVIAQYDNAILYDDYVINSFIQLAEKYETILISFPDHGLDMYESDSSYYGHARLGEKASFDNGTAIPFVIYCSSTFRNKYPEEYEHLKAIKDEPFNTENLMYLIMDVCNVSLLDSNVEKMSNTVQSK